MKKFLVGLIFIGLVLSNSTVFAGGSCLTNPTTRNNYYNSRKQGDNLTNYNNKKRLDNSSGPDWVRRQERQNYDLHKHKRQHSDFTERHYK